MRMDGRKENQTRAQRDTETERTVTEILFERTTHTSIWYEKKNSFFHVLFANLWASIAEMKQKQEPKELLTWNVVEMKTTKNNI